MSRRQSGEPRDRRRKRRRRPKRWTARRREARGALRGSLATIMRVRRTRTSIETANDQCLLKTINDDINQIKAQIK